MTWLKDALPPIPPPGKPEVLVAISQRKNPGESAVACLVGEQIRARRVGPMSNCRAAWFAAELALDNTSGPIAVVSCLTELSERCLSNTSVLKSERYRGRDADVISRVREKWRGSEFRFRRKHEDKRFDVLRRMANSELDAPLVYIPPGAGSVDRMVDAIAEDSTESPLESALLMAMRKHFPTRVFAPSDATRPHKVSAAYSGPLGTLIPQLKVGPYRGDFGIVNELVRVFVEVDGHKFHDMTRDQLEHDRRRDRYLMREGWRVMRFTGREVYRNAEGCAAEVVATLEGLE